ncbi:MAG: hypothetical protein JWM41_2272 [Gemmatimonadetes bacterium]|nr:hypothetical protein [Gemmatimonadota bacterium]
MNVGRRGRQAVFFAATTIALFASFATNIFGVGGPGQFASFQEDSDALVVERIVTHAEGRDAFFGGFLVASAAHNTQRLYSRPPSARADAAGREAYLSHFGLQGTIAAWLAGTDVERTGLSIARLHLFTALALALVLAALVTAARAELGLAAAVSSVVLLAASNWLVLFSRSLYWEIWTCYLPVLFVWLAYPRLSDRWRIPIVCAGVFGLVLLRALSSYEYITNVALGAAVPLVYFETQRASLRVVARHVVLLIAVGGLAVVAAIALHLHKLAEYLGGWDRAVAVLGDRVVYRSFGVSSLGFGYAPPGTRLLREVVSRAPWCERGCLAAVATGGYLLQPAFTIPGAHVGVPIGFVIGVALALIWRVLRARRAAPGRLLDAREAFAAAALVGLTASVSWAVPMRNHMINHLHINAIIFYLPFLPLAFLLISAESVRALRRIGSRVRVATRGGADVSAHTTAG